MKSYLPGKISPVATACLVAITFFVLGNISLLHAKDNQSPPKASIEYSRDASSLVISYTMMIGEIAGTDRGPSLRVYGDGFVYVHYPVYMTRAGDYGIQLTESEMTQLFESLVADGVVEFDATAAEDRISEINTTRHENEGVIYHVSDPSTSVIEINLVSYTPGGAPHLQQSDLSKKIRWSGLHSDAKQYPDHIAVQNLASAESRLSELMHRTDMVKLEDRNSKALRGSGLD